jgi:hypothetical protein
LIARLMFGAVGIESGVVGHSSERRQGHGVVLYRVNELQRLFELLLLL